MKDETKLKIVTHFLSLIRVVMYILWGFVLGATAAGWVRRLPPEPQPVMHFSWCEMFDPATASYFLIQWSDDAYPR